MAGGSSRGLSSEVRGWLRYLWRKAMTPDDWSRDGEPHPWWDRYSLAPMLSFPRFDLSESSYALLLLARKTPAWREVYTRILDELLRRHTTYWAAVDWLTQIGPDPDRARYPKAYKRLIPKDLWGRYDAPGWTANGIEPWGLQPDPIGSTGNLFFRGFFNLMLAIHREVSGEATWDRPFEVTGLDDRTFPWTHRGIADYLSEQWAKTPHGPHCENTKTWPFCLSAAGLGLQLTDRDARHRDPLGLRPLGRGHVQEEVHGLRRAREPEVGRALLRPAPRPRARRIAGCSASFPRSTSCRRTGGRRAARIATPSRRSAGTSATCRCLLPGVDPAPADHRVPAGARVRRPHDGAPARAQAGGHGELALLRRRGRRRTRTSSATSSSTASATRAARRARSTC